VQSEAPWASRCVDKRRKKSELNVAERGVVCRPSIQALSRRCDRETKRRVGVHDVCDQHLEGAVFGHVGCWGNQSHWWRCLALIGSGTRHQDHFLLQVSQSFSRLAERASCRTTSVPRRLVGIDAAVGTT
jgi:hypothetical protein